MTDPSPIIYRINDHDEIVYVNDAWDRFAGENEGRRAMAGRVLDRRIWDFMGNENVCAMYREVVRVVRQGRRVRFRFRCDSPGVMRLMEMTVRPADDGGVEFQTRLLSKETRPAIRILDNRLPRSEEYLRICGWCHRVWVSGNWEQLDRAVEQLHLLEVERPPALTHGICEECNEKMLALLETT